MQISPLQLEQVNHQIQALRDAGSFYGKKLEEAGITGVSSVEDFENLPFSEKADLRDAYPLGLMTAPEEEIVRIHSSSGTTGLPVISPYTRKDVDDWATMFARCYEIAGVTAVALTKLDGTAKGGIVIAVADSLQIPVKYVGVGEKAEDLMPFEARDFVEALIQE